jgi:hypothetical protein
MIGLLPPVACLTGRAFSVFIFGLHIEFQQEVEGFQSRISWNRRFPSRRCHPQKLDSSFPDWIRSFRNGLEDFGGTLLGFLARISVSFIILMVVFFVWWPKSWVHWFL